MSDIQVQDEPNITTAQTKSTKTASSAEAVAPSADPYSGEECPFNDLITVYTGSRLPHLDQGPVKAYAASGKDKVPARLYALVCEDHLTPRISKVSNYVGIISPSFARLVASGVMYWAPAKKEKYVFLYEHGQGNSIMKDDRRGGLKMRPDIVTNAIIRPMVGLLQDMRDKGLVHGSIRPSNLFDGGQKNFDRVILGDCLCLPESYNMPALYETTERAMCMPSGRTNSTQAHDLYSFGVTLAVLMRHFDPMDGFSEQQVIEYKMEEGSYNALLSKDRFSGAILELLRGLLHDEEDQRWNLDDVLIWMDGRRLSPKQSARRLKANRPILFNGEKYTSPEFFARDLNKNVSEAKNLIDNGEIEQWIERALDDKVLAVKYNKALQLAEEGGKSAGYAERLVARLGIALHPEAPVRFKDIKAFPESIGNVLTESYILKKDVQGTIDFIQNNFIVQWVDAQNKIMPDISSVLGRFDGARSFLKQKGMGGGVERVLYLLNQDMRCLSDKLEKYYVRNPEDLMRAYEKISASPSRSLYFMDRHIVAFLAVKDRKIMEAHLHDLNSEEPYKRILAEIKVLATIQKRSQMEKLPGVCEWISDSIDPLYERFHDRELRKEIRKKVDLYKSYGDISKIVSLFDDARTQNEDSYHFKKAMHDYYDLEDEEKSIEYNLKHEGRYGLESGMRAALVVSSILSLIILLFVLLSGSKAGVSF